ncbi:MAG: hypothetical protein NTX44_05070 [Ignavibacteriales bacterium]|nr:hypothetical protein [Ignavibacteriales bacterium]
MEHVIPILTFIKDISWPLVIFIIFLYLKKDISVFLATVREKLTSATIGNVQFDLSNKSKPANLSIPDSTIPDKPANWQNVANIFWVGHDLMWTIDVIFRNGNKEFIARGLKQSLHHLSCIFSSDHPTIVKMKQIVSKLNTTLESDFDVNKRMQFASDVGSILSEFGSIVGKHQPNFQPEPEQ